MVKTQNINKNDDKKKLIKKNDILHSFAIFPNLCINLVKKSNNYELELLSSCMHCHRKKRISFHAKDYIDTMNKFVNLSQTLMTEEKDENENENGLEDEKEKSIKSFETPKELDQPCSDIASKIEKSDNMETPKPE